MKRNLVLYIAVSLDGYIARNNGDVEWLEGDGSQPDAPDGYSEFYNTIDTIIMGNTTYEQIMKWGEYPYKGKVGYIYTTKGGFQNENVIFTEENPKVLIDKLRGKEGKDIWLVGGGKIIKAFMDDNLIDQYIITTIPVILGEGIPLFHPNGLGDIKLQLKDSKIINGMVQNYYVKR